MTQVPILFLSDSPDLTSGLARIGRDLASLLSRNPKFRVGYLGFGGIGSSKLPFQQYTMQDQIEWGQYGQKSLGAAWNDLSRGEPGVIFTIWDLSRLLWLARPEYMTENYRPPNAKIWSYLPVDSQGPHGKLTHMSAETMLGIDRLLCYSPWAKIVVERTIGTEEAVKRGLDWMPHGLSENWTPEPKRDDDNNIHVGVVATNQARKDWGLVANACHALHTEYGERLHLWWHVDQPIGAWSIPALLLDYGLGDITEVTHSLTEKEMATHYRSCDVTLHPGLGEGFGYPIFESLACGTPAFHGNYGGGASILETCGLKNNLWEPVGWRVEGQQNCMRPIYFEGDLVDCVMAATDDPIPGNFLAPVDHLYWKNLWSRWNHWFEDGIA